MKSKQTKHQKRVEEFMLKAGQEVPMEPIIPSEEVRILRARLILEEALETIQKGLAVNVKVNGGVVTPNEGLPVTEATLVLSINQYKRPDIEEVADGCADISVVTVGTLSACGIKDKDLLKEVDNANLRKFSEGSYRREDGKWIKPKDWTPPNIMGVLKKQGYRK